MASGDTSFLVIFLIAQLQLLTLVFMTVVFEAFSKLTARHTALVLLFSKELATHMLEFFNTFVLVAFDLMNLPRPQGFERPMLFCSTYLYFIVYIHVLAMALNRLCAVFWPRKYDKLWSKKGTIYICIFVWIVGIGLGSHQVVYFTYNPFINPAKNNITIAISQNTTGEQTLVSTFRASMNDAVQFVVILVSVICYFAILIKLVHEKMSPPKSASPSSPVAEGTSMSAEMAQKDRLMLCAVFFASVIPLPLNHLIEIKANYQHSLTGNLLIILHYTNGTLFQCLDELLLFLLCREFRDRVKQQIAHTKAKLGQMFCCCCGSASSVSVHPQQSQQQQYSTHQSIQQQQTPVQLFQAGWLHQ